MKNNKVGELDENGDIICDFGDWKPAVLIVANEKYLKQTGKHNEILSFMQDALEKKLGEDLTVFLAYADDKRFEQL